MRAKSSSAKATPGERVVKDIRRATRRQFSADFTASSRLATIRVSNQPRCAAWLA